MSAIDDLFRQSLVVAANKVGPLVTLIKLEGLPGAQLFDEASAFRSTLFISASRTWNLLGREERRSIVRGLATFAADRGFDTVSVVGALGEPWPVSRTTK